MSDDYDSAAEALAALTGRDRDAFEPGDIPIPDFGEQSVLQKESAEAVYVVVSRYGDDPHPHVEGVYRDKSDAEDVMDKCRDKFAPPHPIAWQLIEETVQNSK